MWTLLNAVPPWGKVVGVMLLAIAIVAGFRACSAASNHKIDAAIGAAEEKGAATAALDAAMKGMEIVEKANAAAAAVDRDDAARRAGCLRHSRTPENC
jgi:hypothetical protein